MPHWTKNGGMVLRFPAKMQKSRKTSMVATTPEFARLLAEVPKHKQTGYVLNVAMQRPPRGGRRYQPKEIGRIISAIGAAANVVVNEHGKPASAHDLRRGFGQRLANRGVPVRDLQALMRHSRITTTEKYYLRQDAEGLAERLPMYLVKDECDEADVILPNPMAEAGFEPARELPPTGF